MSRLSLLSAFATPVVNLRLTDFEEMNASLREAVETRRGSAATDRSNVGGWHSELDFFSWEVPAVRSLRAQVLSVIDELNQATFETGRAPSQDEMRLDAWANVLTTGAYNSLHAHPNALWSGVYYLTDNEVAEGYPFSGRLELIDPRPAASVGFADDMRLNGRFMINPREGQIIVFPSWLQHCVHPYFGVEARVSVAFNVVLLR
ncbi:MAG: 2OG-Fe(II) oxygenase family protein [Pseudomonadota bacterium]